MSKLKLYLNENLSWRIARALRGYGYDVISSHEANMNAEPDDEQFAFAVSQSAQLSRTIFEILSSFIRNISIGKKITTE